MTKELLEFNKFLKDIDLKKYREKYSKIKQLNQIYQKIYSVFINVMNIIGKSLSYYHLKSFMKNIQILLKMGLKILEKNLFLVMKLFIWAIQLEFIELGRL